MRAPPLLALAALLAAGGAAPPSAGAAAPPSAGVIPGCRSPLTTSGSQPLISDPCPGIRPGALMTSPTGCTMNFAFASGTDRYIGTAAHCVGGLGQSVSLSGEGAIGTVAYLGSPDGVDFALVKVSASKLGRVDPALCHWGGPTSLAIGFQDEPVVLDHYGHGIVTGTLTATKARRGIGYAWSDSVFYFAGAVAFGDSGSPAMTEGGKAAGVVVAIGPYGNVATRLDVAVQKASARLGVPLTLLTAPLA